jgi:hypothetical protein
LRHRKNPHPVEGATHEKVRDIACADGLEVDPTTPHCPDNGASVDLTTCQPTGDNGAMQLATAWKDPDFDSAQGAFYYVRVLQNPTCRWSTYDALRLGLEPDPRVPATLRERVWSSPIWIDASWWDWGNYLVSFAGACSGNRVNARAPRRRGAIAGQGFNTSCCLVTAAVH